MTNLTRISELGATSLMNMQDQLEMMGVKRGAIAVVVAIEDGVLIMGTMGEGVDDFLKDIMAFRASTGEENIERHRAIFREGKLSPTVDILKARAKTKPPKSKD